ncbi:MAG TPA: carboxypeptidase-like regulatory domain-containing protein [Thermoguttaceae bacterium]|nr:carboxypeptidase-like regulatory domain-containing protein [Thermoguttaceae bacterium]
MKGAVVIQRVVVCLALVGICLPQLAFASTPQTATPVTDVQLREGNVLIGKVITPENAAVADTQVTLLSAGQKIAQGKTDTNGYFAFSGVRTGLYQVAAADGQGTYRLWSERTAPPKVQQGALVYAGTQTVRGQSGFRGVRNFLANPIVIAGIVATAIAVPVAIHNSKKKSGS